MVQEGEVGAPVRDAFTGEVGGPPLAAAPAVGLVISLVQAITQTNEQNVAFVPKSAR